MPLNTGERKDVVDLDQSLRIADIEKQVKEQLVPALEDIDKARKKLPMWLAAGAISLVGISFTLGLTVASYRAEIETRISSLEHAHESLAAHRGGFEKP